MTSNTQSHRTPNINITLVSQRNPYACRCYTILVTYKSINSVAYVQYHDGIALNR